jgi:murein DD-endopeptidase MepM/ murein hydrolase activator NlpD
MQRLARLRRSFEELFPERQIYVRSGGQMRAFVLTTSRQMAGACAVAGAALWMGVCTAAMLLSMFSASSTDREVARIKSQSERWIADRQARLNSALAQLNAGGGSAARLAADTEKRHAALALLLTDLRGAPGAAEALTPTIDKVLANGSASPARRMEMVRISQERLLDAADDFAKSRAERLRLAFRLAGLTPTAYAPEASSLGGPLIESKDPKALAAVLDVDEDFAVRIENAANDLSQARALAGAAQSLPFGEPTRGTERSSGFGVRFDPFTHHLALHAGLDFAGAPMTPVLSTGPGVISFTGVRSGYGNTIEIDHGHGLKTRYAHLATIGVTVGERVAVGQRIGGMGSTGRSTGTHLHYEVWVNGRAQNPDRFLKAGADVLQQAG